MIRSQTQLQNLLMSVAKKSKEEYFAVFPVDFIAPQDKDNLCEFRDWEDFEQQFKELLRFFIREEQKNLAENLSVNDEILKLYIEQMKANYNSSISTGVILQMIPVTGDSYFIKRS